MRAVFYSFSKRRNSTAAPAEGTELEITLKNGCSFLSPIFLLNSDSFQFNYCSFDGRFYWVNDIVSLRNNLFEVHCNVDVLASWKSEILQTRGFVAYSSSDYNSNITDARNKVSQVKERKVSLMEFDAMMQTGCFVLCTSGGAEGVTHQSFTAMYALTQGALSGLALEFNTDEVLSQISQFFSNPLDTVIFCRWLPLDGSKIGSGIANIEFGNYHSGATGAVINKNYYYESKKITIPWLKDDFRKVEPFSMATLYLPGVGEVNLNLSPLYGLNELTITMVCDLVGSSVHYTIEDMESSTIIGTYSGTFGVDIPVSSVQANNIGGFLTGVAKIAGGAVALAGGIASGGIGIVAAGGAATMAKGFADAGSSAFSQNAKSTGTFSGGYSVWSGGTAVRLEIQRSLSVQEPTDYRETIGLPCMKNRAINGLSGYVQTSGFEVSGAMSATEKSQINQFMDGGVYIE